MMYCCEIWSHDFQLTRKTWKGYKGKCCLKGNESILVKIKGTIRNEQHRDIGNMRQKTQREDTKKEENKGNNKITEHRAIFQRERQNSQVNKQTKSVNNRKAGKTAMALTWYRHFQRNGGLHQILRRQSSRFDYG